MTYIRGAHGVILIYDVTNRKNFKTIENWIKLIEANSSRKITIFLVGSKIDNPEREVSTEEGNKLAEELGLKFFECSSKTNYNVVEIFQQLAETIYNLKEIQYFIRCKILMLGDVSTGKSSILRYYIDPKIYK